MFLDFVYYVGIFYYYYFITIILLYYIITITLLLLFTMLVDNPHGQFPCPAYPETLK